jgi:hypothetical protein
MKTKASSFRIGPWATITVTLVPALSSAVAGGACDLRLTVGAQDAGPVPRAGYGGHAGATSPFGSASAGAGGTAVSDAGSGGAFPASTLFLPAVLYPVAGGATQVGIGDLNGDLRPDIAVNTPAGPRLEDGGTVSGGAILSVFLSTGILDYAPAQTYVPGEFPYALGVGDLDGDGRNDLAVSNKLDVSVMLNDGSGALGPPFHLPSGPNAVGLTLGDTNGDGRTDIMVANSSYFNSTGEVDVLLNMGDRMFARTAYARGLGNNYGSALGDLDGNGKPDMVLVNNRLDVLLNAGDGTFGGHTSYGSASYPPGSVAIADLNGDGLADLATTSSNSEIGGASVFFNLGNGAFGPEVKYVFSPSGANTIAIGDVNRDGLPELVMGWTSFTVAVLLNQGAGTFSPPVSVNVGEPVSSFPLHLAVGDLNRDGAADIVCTTETGVAILFANH